MVVRPWFSFKRVNTANLFFFSHSVRSNLCVLCESCEPEILLGDDTFASFQRVAVDPSVLYEGKLAR